MKTALMELNFRACKNDEMLLCVTEPTEPCSRTSALSRVDDGAAWTVGVGFPPRRINRASLRCRKILLRTMA
jgi:hypothetical protein